MKKIISAGLMLLLVSPAFAQKKGTAAPEKPAEKKTTIAEKTKACKKTDGLFPLYQDTVNGNLYLLVKKNHLNRQYIYFAYTENGVLGAGHFKGSFRDNKVFTVKKYFDRVEFVVQNTNFYFDSQSEISKAANANISNATLVSQKPVAEDPESGDMLLDGSAIFMSESWYQVKPSPMPPPFPNMSLLGSLSKEKTKLVNLRNYEKNTDIVVEYVYENPLPVLSGGAEVTDPRSISIVLQHSLIEAPDEPMKPRYDDPRVGFFMEEINDMTTTSIVAFHDVIHRWRLEKKDKGAALSEPVTPITYWIENTTPKELRETIKAAAMRWNFAFEKAGFKNAIEIKEQPDDVTWDAGDIRYNVLRWTSSPTPPFGGYGPSFVDPRTGEILGADIMLEYIFITNRIRQERLFNVGAAAETPQFSGDQHFCNAGEELHMTSLFGMSVLEARGLNEVDKRDYIKQSLYYLVLHEMGHTLGLMHNMKASQMLNPKQVNDRSVTQEMGLTASVMDYPAANIATDKTKQGDYFTMRPGPYDLWAIEYGYSEGVDDEAAERQRLAKILERSTDSTLIFGNDADDMRSPGKAIDPRVNINDMSNDAIGYSVDRMKLVGQLLPTLKEKYSKRGESYQEMRQAYVIALNEWLNASTTISRYIGGVYVDRSFYGQNGATKPFTPVDIKDQKRAMQALAAYVFSPSATNAPSDLYSYLQMQRRGFNFFGGGEEPRIHDRIMLIQSNVLDHLLHQNTLRRITDSRLYGNKYSAIDMMTDLTNACFKEDAATNANTFRQNLQMDYVKRLIRIADTKVSANSYDDIARSAAMAQLKNIKRMISNPNPALNAETNAHRDHLILLIDKAFAKD
jgi:hypothetical protein